MENRSVCHATVTVFCFDSVSLYFSFSDNFQLLVLQFWHSVRYQRYMIVSLAEDYFYKHRWPLKTHFFLQTPILFQMQKFPCSSQRLVRSERRYGIRPLGTNSFRAKKLQQKSQQVWLCGCSVHLLALRVSWSDATYHTPKPRVLSLFLAKILSCR